MTFTLTPWTIATLSIIALFCAVTAGIAFFLAVAGGVRRRRRGRIRQLREMILGEWLENASDEELALLIGREHLRFLAAYQESIGAAAPSDATMQRIGTAFRGAGTDIRLIREIHRKSRFHRSRAALYLGYVHSDSGAAILDLALRKERSDPVRLRIVHAIVQQRYLQSIPTILDTLQGASDEYVVRATGLILELGHELTLLVPVIHDRKEPEIQSVFIKAAARCPTDAMREYLQDLVERGNTEIARAAFQVLLNHYTRTIDPFEYLRHRDGHLVNLAVEALGGFPADQTIDTVIPFLGTEEFRKSAIVALAELIGTVPHYLPTLIERFRDETDHVLQTGIAEVLATRAEYVCDRVLRESWTASQRVLSMLVATRKASGVLAFLNRNTDPEIEQAICRRIGGTVREDEWLREEYGIYAKDSVIAALGIERSQISTDRAERKRENPAGVAVAAIIATSLLLPPITLLLSQLVAGGWDTLPAILRGFYASYTIWFEEAFVVYAIALNSIYLVLLVAAVRAVIEAARLWETRPDTFLYTPGILPAVSIIAPAYNEQETIVESVRALLNLRYPEYEVIVVNDGSIDKTLERLITTFQLERTKVFMHGYLGTRPIRGVYRNRNLPGLLVVDKSNGGKADSLNAGINASRHPYYAAIDADSLLEPDALILLAAETLDSEKPVTATGGNVLPINGCRVEYGSIDEVRFPRNPLAQFQVVEYIRSFMTGRTGWARLNTLLIISGAFGLFNRQDVIDARGYLTSSERLLKDTVAEDMELVVRLTRRLRERGREGVIRYAPGANCWTEVPETARILAAQRDRWQRGLVDVLFFHRRMAFRRVYGRAGMAAMPYHYIFELVGPWVEAQALILLIPGLITGVLPLQIAALVFTVSIGLGTLTSMLAVQLAEWRAPIFRRLDRVLVFFYSIIENFGYRQFSSLLRLRGYISILRQKTGWGTMRRRGFSQQKE